MTSTAFSNDPEGAAPLAGHVLILNNAEERLQLCLARDGQVLAHQDWVAPGQAMRRLAPALDQTLNALDLKASDLTGIACVRGPGGFTGLRLCLATMYGLAFAAGLPMAGLDYLPLLASGPASLLRGRLAVLTHARHGLVNAQVFSVPDIAPLTPPQVMSMDGPDMIPDLLATEPDVPLCILGSGARRNMAGLSASLPHARILDPAWDHPRPEDLIRAAMQAQFSHEPVAPLYLRPSDAEENIQAIAARRGLNLCEASELLAAGLEGLPENTSSTS